MTDEQKKKYEEDCYNSGNLDYPLAGCILTPLCKICKNFNQEMSTYKDFSCRSFGHAPEPIVACKKYECECFEHDKESRLNIFFDENLQPIYKQENRFLQFHAMIQALCYGRALFSYPNYPA